MKIWINTWGQKGLKCFILSFFMVFSVILQGCATDKAHILPQDGPTMKDVYDNHFSGTGPLDPAQLENSQESQTGSNSNAESVAEENPKTLALKRPSEPLAPLEGYTRTAKNEIQAIFPRLKNPTLILYVFPHLSDTERHPVPGYATAFSLFETAEYALPGEPEEGY